MANRACVSSKFVVVCYGETVSVSLGAYDCRSAWNTDALENTHLHNQ